MKTILVSRPASALLLSFFLMSLLVLVGMAVSILVLHDLRAVRVQVSGAQAFYAAEGLTEVGLLALDQNLPGYEPSTSEGYEFLNQAVASLVVNSRGATIPCEGQGEEWRSLAHNESIQIPLFAQIDSEGHVEDIQDFYVAFYITHDDGSPYFIDGLDALRWKILGLKHNRTEAVSEYIPLNGSKNSSGDPSIFGPSNSVAGVPSSYKAGKYYQSASFPAVLSPTEPIATFLQEHSYNYLVLTNVVQQRLDSTIHFRFHALDYEAVCEYSALYSTGAGANGEAHQDLNTFVREGENLPVFDFVLYHTGDQE